MKRLPDNVINFLQNQGFVIVSTIDRDGFPHNSCKGILKIDREGQVYLLDLYKANTFENLKLNPHISITAIDEHKFAGFCLKGRAKALPEGALHSQVIKDWEEKIIARITRRLLKNIQEQKGHPRHPEILLPKPQYMIAVEVEEIIDLTPHQLK